MHRKTYICNGDSWVFGCEIADPEIASRYPRNTHPGEYDFLVENDQYRLPKIFPTHLHNITGNEVVNLSWPADDNTTILHRTISYITENYIAKKLPTDDLFVIVGWSSPERNSFWFKDSTFSTRFRLWPQVPRFDVAHQERFWEYYVGYLWNPEEYIPRYIMTVLQLQTFCNQHNIKWMCFNSFYQTPLSDVTQWQDLDVSKELNDIHNKTGGYHVMSTDTGLMRRHIPYSYRGIWDTIDPVRFYKKDEQNNTFKSFIEGIGSRKPDFPVFSGWHPSPESHAEWANELANYIKTNGLD